MNLFTISRIIEKLIGRQVADNDVAAEHLPVASSAALCDPVADETVAVRIDATR
ncbi:hypothetical protein [Thermohalobaculum xanthum]|uniref:hypothetical protein n=1 Tax=Thermohalobaculum xanthum TaxID=2753746 RepID=UPI00190B2CCB|nr:hypothetical protein [Thermohalobaculum xanthum]